MDFPAFKKKCEEDPCFLTEQIEGQELGNTRLLWILASPTFFKPHLAFLMETGNITYLSQALTKNSDVFTRVVTRGAHQGLSIMILLSNTELGQQRLNSLAAQGEAGLAGIVTVLKENKNALAWVYLRGPYNGGSLLLFLARTTIGRRILTHWVSTEPGLASLLAALAENPAALTAVPSAGETSEGSGSGCFTWVANT